MTMNANQAFAPTIAHLQDQSDDPRQTIPAFSGLELRVLLDPISPETFFAEYWERKPLFIKGGLDKLERLLPGGFTMAHFWAAVREAEDKKIKGFRLWAQRPKERDVYIRSDQIEETLAAGINIATESPSDPRLVRLVTALKTQLQHPGDISYAATLSPAGQGWPLHIDRSINLSVQCEGRKLFILSEAPVLEWPIGSISFAEDGAVERALYHSMSGEEALRVETSGLLEFEAEPGDVIYWPAGTLHTTRALSDLSLTVHAIINHETFLNLFSRFLYSAFVGHPEWRHLPSVPTSSLMPGQLPTEAKEFFAARLQELRAYLAALSPDAMEFNCEWHKLLAAPGETITPYLLSTQPEQDERAIEPTDVFRLSQIAPLTYTFGCDAEGEPSFYLYFADKEMSVSGDWCAFLQTLVRQERFVALSATEWAADGQRYPWDTVQVYLQVLFDQGILEREAA